ncbi:MAG: glycosyltransferase family 4 protein [Planctomycetaceae bacterium]|nr:glycosyltransferase family 4 protein [Planctomycetaceae bacterium]
MHVLLIHQAFISPKEAGGTRHLELGQRFVREGNAFTIVASNLSYHSGKAVEPSDGDCEEYDGVQVRRAWTLAALHRSYAWRVASFLTFMVSSIWTALRVRDVDLVMGTSPPIFQLLSAWFVAVIKRKPFVLEVRDLWPEFAIDIGLLKNPVLIWCARALEKFLYSRATHLVVNSPAYRDYLINKGVPAEKVSFIANGVDTSLFSLHVDGSGLRDQYKLNGKFVVTYAGAVSMANDLDVVLDAAEMLKDAPDVHLLIVGDGKDCSRLQERAARMHLPNITFTGPRPKDEMPRFLAMSDACLATLKDIPMFRTTYPNKVFDYMAAGRPTILGIDGVIRDVIEAADGGVAVPPGDAASLAAAIRELSHDRPRCEQMGRAAREYVQHHFNRDQQAIEFRHTIEQVALRRAA